MGEAVRSRERLKLWLLKFSLSLFCLPEVDSAFKVRSSPISSCPGHSQLSPLNGPSTRFILLLYLLGVLLLSIVDSKARQ